MSDTMEARGVGRGRAPSSLAWGLLWITLTLMFFGTVIFVAWATGYNGYGGSNTWQRDPPSPTGPGPSPLPPSRSPGPTRP